MPLPTDDMQLSSYGPCDTSYSPPVGVCPSGAYATAVAATQPPSRVTLEAASRVGGVTTLLMSRPLAAGGGNSIAINATASANYVWAHGPLTPG